MFQGDDAQKTAVLNAAARAESSFLGRLLTLDYEQFDEGLSDDE